MNPRAPMLFQDASNRWPKAKMEARDDSGSQNVALKFHRTAKRRARASKKCPRDAQGAPKRGQEPPKSEQKPAR